METNWATEHLQVIRTLMERSAVYRRALAPTMTLTGVLGVGAAVTGWLARIDAPRAFATFWLAISVVAIVGSLLLVRRQALREGEPFWSPPTRRVIQALMPPLGAGFILSVLAIWERGTVEQGGGSQAETVWFAVGWIIFYGCALHAAGFFMPRGMKLFGWAFVLGGCGLGAIVMLDRDSSLRLYPHALMGLFFGVLHLAYGFYLYITEQRKHAA